MVHTLYPREEPFSSLRNLKNGFVGKCRSFTVLYETLGRFLINPMKSWFCTKPLRVSYETIKDLHFPTKPFFKFRNEEKGFSPKGSSRGYKVRTIKGSIELKIRFLSILTHFETFSSLRNLFSGFRKEPMFFRM